MRAKITLVMGAAIAAFALVACGKPKQADDPTNESTHPPPDDGTGNVKWEGASPPPPPPSKGQGTSATGSVHEAETRRNDVYDKEATEVVLKRAARQVKDNCGAATDESGKATGPWGKATLQVQLGHNGHSKGVVVPPPYQGKPVGNCVEKAFANLTFPPWGGADTEVPWEVEIAPPSKK